jgi:arsenate reductase-like glutaredoxin family protein
MDPSKPKTEPKLLAEDIEYEAEIVDDDEPTSEELVEMLRESVQQANLGQTRPIDELLRELDDILANSDDVG